MKNEGLTIDSSQVCIDFSRGSKTNERTKMTVEKYEEEQKKKTQWDRHSTVLSV